VELDAPHTTSIRDEELTLELDGAAGAVVSELDDVVKVVVVIGDMLLARSIATIPNLYAVPAYKAAAL
jgi:hypothetical protein